MKRAWREGDRVRSVAVPVLRGTVTYATQRGRTERDKRLSQHHSYVKVQWDADALAVANEGRVVPLTSVGRIPPAQIERIEP